MKVKMLKTKSPDEIPNGTIGYVCDGRDIHEPGLHAVYFAFDKIAYVYSDEVSVLEEYGKANNI